MPRHKSDGSQAEASRRRRRRCRQHECCVSVRRDGVSSGYRRRAIVSSARLGVVRDPATKASVRPASSLCTLASLVATMQTFGFALCWLNWLRTSSCVSLLCLCVWNDDVDSGRLTDATGPGDAVSPPNSTLDNLSLPNYDCTSVRISLASSTTVTKLWHNCYVCKYLTFYQSFCLVCLFISLWFYSINMNTIYRLQGNVHTSVKIRYIYQAGKYLDKGYIILFINSSTYLRLWYAILKCI